jgi:hypothetical protein
MSAFGRRGDLRRDSPESFKSGVEQIRDLTRSSDNVRSCEP